MFRRPKRSRFQLRDSDRSGFTYRAQELVNDKGRWVGPDELDQPPPSTESLGGEGDISGSPRTTADQFTMAYVTGGAISVTLVQAAVSLTPLLPNPYDRTGNVLPVWMSLAGTATTTTMSANPQILPGAERQVLTLECVSNGITWLHGNGLTLMGGRLFRMQSGSVISFLYNSANATWTETSRTP